MTDMKQNRLLLQFHITGRCNLRCKHCYRTEGDREPLDYAAVERVIDQFLQLRRAYNAHYGIRKKGHINITGGEPLFHKDMDRILALLGSHRQEFSFGILSNGSFLDERRMALLKENGVSFVQLSIDGDRAAHDSLRAPGDYDRVFAKAAQLEKAGIPTYISFTANRENIRHLPQVAAMCRKCGVTKLWSDRLVPIGNGENMRALWIGPEEFPEYLRQLKKARGGILTRLLHPRTQVTMNRALQFQAGCGLMYACSAADSLITVDEFGRILPCRRMPIDCGDVFASSLEQVYFHHPTFRALRAAQIPRDCGSCPHGAACKGGARCQSYAINGCFDKKDPGCPLR